MASSPQAPTLLENLPARPPTPPRDTACKESVDLRKPLVARPSSFNPRLNLQTPPNANSPASSAVNTDSTNPGSGRMGKRVLWSAHTEYRDPPDYKAGDKPHKSSPLVTTPSALATTKPLKGILKPSPSPKPLVSALGDQLGGTGAQVNITEMLDSTIKQLTGPDRTSRLDAYMMLSRALKASNNLPDRVALQHKMSLFVQFIQRDVTSKREDGSPDASLVNHALTLLTTFLHFHAIASTITSEFSVFIIDYAIRVFEDPASTKDVVRHSMQVVATQNFSPKVMTADRVGRLIVSLHGIEDHMKGKSVITGRLHIYRKLVKQSRNHMTIHTDWLKDMFTDMLSTIKEIQTQAINLGMEAGFSLLQAHQVMRKVTDILQTSNEDVTYVDFYTKTLAEMVKDKQRSATVPQIWSVITLFLRCPLDRWDNYGPWFSLIQSAFNTSDSLTKREANHAWNRYVFLCLMGNKPTSKLLSALSQPLISQLRRKTSLKQPEESKKLRRTVISGVCNLHYYAFRPGSERISPPEITWDIAVQPVISQLAGLDGPREVPADDIMQASRILVGLLDVSTPIVWREDRIVDLPPVKPDDLPSIESKWIRRNSERVFKAVGPILEKKFTDLANKESLTHRLWEAVVGSVAAASAKDIKVSEDTAGFFACAFGLLSRVWAEGCPESEELLRTKFYPSTRNFIEILVHRLGLLPFMEKRLSMTVSNTFEPVATPSHRPDRPDKPRGVVRTPLQHLFTMLSAIPRGGADDEVFSEFFQSVFEPFFVGKSDKIRLDLTRELLRLLPENTLSPFALWSLGAQAVQLSFTLPENSVHVEDKIPGPEFREVVSFLERGLTSHPNLPAKSWLSLFDAFSQRVAAGYGDAGRAIVLLEPLAKTLLAELTSGTAQPSTRTLEAARTMFQSAKLPRDRHVVDIARRRIWGDPAVISKATSPDPFDGLYKLGNHVSKYYYEHFDDIGPESAEVAAFVKSMGDLALESFAAVGFETLPKLQDGMALWFQDEKGQLKLSNESPLSTTIRELWTKICTELLRHHNFDRSQFDLVEGLLTAAFTSKHRFIVNKAAEMWNDMVKDKERLECSDSLTSVVSSLRPHVDIILPGAEQPGGESGAQPPSFVDSQEDSEPSGSSRDVEVVPAATTSTPSKLSLRSSPRKRPLEATPTSDVGRTRASKRASRSSRTSTPRLCHDNSQIQFQPIASSSPAVEESQHLTERQKEVRERQKQNATLYSDARPDSPPAQVPDAEPAKEAAEDNNKQQPQETTPQRTTSYGELISSTPTPRRGEVIPMDGDNDPPSSPPDPRPYLLLSEIRSRSRTNSLENWNFSSPPSSPVTSRQQVMQEAELPHVTLTDESTQARAGALSQSGGRTTRSTRKRRSSPPPVDVIPSSIPEKSETTKSVNTRSSRSRRSLKDAEAPPPATPPRKRASQQTVEASAEEEFVDSRTNVERSSPGLPEMPPPPAVGPEDISYALSEGDESQMMKLATELESKQGKEVVDKETSAEQDLEAPAVDVAECITVQTKSASPSIQEKANRREKRTRGQVESSPALSTDGEGSQVGRRRKRKRGPAKTHESRRKKRRSMELLSASPHADDLVISSVGSSSPAKETKGGMRTRRSTRQAERQSQEEQADEQEDEVVNSSMVDASADKDGGDTDEEVLSQLMTESNAASNSQEQQEDAEVPEVVVLPEPDADQKVEEALPGEEAGFKDAGTILETLRGGLDGLRNASLSRTEVYEIEDMLMDMKRELFEAERRGRQSV